jgi:hypothetical protein
MVFSGFTSVRGCEECEYETMRATPTSILFFPALAILGTGFVVPGFSGVFGSRWWYWLAVPVAELLVIFLAMGALVWLRDRLHPFPASCPHCSGKVVSKGGGFYDFGCLPSALEFLLLILFVGAHLALGLALAASAAH